MAKGKKKNRYQVVTGSRFTRWEEDEAGEKILVTYQEGDIFEDDHLPPAFEDVVKPVPEPEKPVPTPPAPKEPEPPKEDKKPGGKK